MAGSSWILRAASGCRAAAVFLGTASPRTALRRTLPRFWIWRSPEPRALLHCTHSCLKKKKEPVRPKGAAAGSEDPEEDEEDELEEEEDEELLSPLPPVVRPGETQRIFVVHPDIKWGPKKPHLTTAQLQLAEAVALVNSLPSWTVVDTLILSTKTPDSKLIFGKGNFQTLTEKVKGLPQLTSVFLNVERISAVTSKELEEAWGVKVFDRYTVVLHIFRYNARTREAKLQIALAELPLLRSNLKNDLAHLDQQGGGSRYIMGSGETFLEMQQRLLKEKEHKIRNALGKLKKKRHLLRAQRQKREFPIISVMGYTNCGKTTLIKALTGDEGMQPRNQLFATLDVTAHAGFLSSRLPVIYVDTIGFLSQLPHNLIKSFSATLEDVVHSDVIVHVRDISHPETIPQKESVLAVLNNLEIPRSLLDSIIEVHNKVDLIDGYETMESSALPISALHGYGLDNLKEVIESVVLKQTGKRIMTIKVDLTGPQLSWLHKEATVQDVAVFPEDNTANVKVIISDAAYGKYRKQFQQW